MMYRYLQEVCFSGEVVPQLSNVVPSAAQLALKRGDSCLQPPIGRQQLLANARRQLQILLLLLRIIRHYTS